MFDTNLFIITTFSFQGSNVACKASIQCVSVSKIYSFETFSIISNEKLPSAAPISSTISL